MNTDIQQNFFLFFSEKKDGNMALYAGEGRESAGENRGRFFASRGIDLSCAVFLQQTHGDHIALVRAEDIGKGSKRHEDALPDSDAMIADVPGTALCVQVADCVPILLWDVVRGVTASVHSGWRGTLQNIAGKTVQKMIERYGCDPKNIYAWIGPAIGGCCLSVDDRIALPVENGGLDGLSPDKTHWDIAIACQGQLVQSGVLPQNIDFSGECTVCHPEKYFSYKREGDRAGRMLAGIALLVKR
jgi:polyphenol oxidase